MSEQKKTRKKLTANHKYISPEKFNALPKEATYEETVKKIPVAKAIKVLTKALADGDETAVEFVDSLKKAEAERLKSERENECR